MHYQYIFHSGSSDTNLVLQMLLFLSRNRVKVNLHLLAASGPVTTVRKSGASGPQRTLRRKQRTTSRSKLQLSGGSDGPKRSFPKGTSRSMRKFLKCE